MTADLEDSEPQSYYVTTRRTRTVQAQPPTISTPEDLYELIHPLVRDADREHFYGVYLTTKNTLLAIELVSLGSLSASLIHPREVFKPAILYSAGALAVAHNHPSGNAEPSQEDRDFTRRLGEAGTLLGIKVLDHVVIGDGDYMSLKSLGYL